jgi:dienelactone hydrolase
LLLDLLTPEEEAVDLVTARLRFDVGLLAGRLLHAIEWVQSNPWLSGLPLGLFGSSTGAAAALVAAARRPRAIQAIVCRGGRPDLAGDALPHVRTPTLLIVGGEDSVVFELNQLAVGRLRAPVELAIVPGATHLFEEPGALERVAELALDWFVSHLSPGANWPLVTGSGDGAGEGNAPNRQQRGRP